MKIYEEMITHVPVCTHKEPSKVLVISQKGFGIIDEIAKYKLIDSKVIDTDIESLRDMGDNSFDIVISEAGCESAVVAHINRVLKDDGVAVFSDFDLNDIANTKAKLEEITKYFKIAMPYHLGECNYAVLASKYYHPTADINLQRADLTDGFEVYNSDLHVASFALPTYIKKRYLGIIKN